MVKNSVVERVQGRSTDVLPCHLPPCMHEVISLASIESDKDMEIDAGKLRKIKCLGHPRGLFKQCNIFETDEGCGTRSGTRRLSVLSTKAAVVDHMCGSVAWEPKSGTPKTSRDFLGSANMCRTSPVFVVTKSVPWSYPSGARSEYPGPGIVELSSFRALSIQEDAVFCVAVYPGHRLLWRELNQCVGLLPSAASNVVNLVFVNKSAADAACELLVTCGFAVTAPLRSSRPGDGHDKMPPHTLRGVAVAPGHVSVRFRDCGQEHAEDDRMNVVVVNPSYNTSSVQTVRRFDGFVGDADLCNGIPYTHRGLVFRNKISAQVAFMYLRTCADVAAVRPPRPFVQGAWDPWVSATVIDYSTAAVKTALSVSEYEPEPVFVYVVSVQPKNRVQWAALTGCVGVVTRHDARSFCSDDLAFLPDPGTVERASDLLTKSGFAVTMPLPALVTVCGEGMFYQEASETRQRVLQAPHLCGGIDVGRGHDVALCVAAEEDEKEEDVEVEIPHMITVFPRSVSTTVTVRALFGFIKFTDLCNGVPFTHIGAVFVSEAAASVAYTDLKRAGFRKVSIPCLHKDPFPVPPWIIP